ncbi:MAG: hypothetical protein AAB360_02660 [Patescibacteria group bacterium]
MTIRSWRFVVTGLVLLSGFAVRAGAEEADILATTPLPPDSAVEVVSDQPPVLPTVEERLALLEQQGVVIRQLLAASEKRETDRELALEASTRWQISEQMKVEREKLERLLADYISRVDDAESRFLAAAAHDQAQDKILTYLRVEKAAVRYRLSRYEAQQANAGSQLPRQVSFREWVGGMTSESFGQLVQALGKVFVTEERAREVAREELRHNGEANQLQAKAASRKPFLPLGESGEKKAVAGEPFSREMVLLLLLLSGLSWGVSYYALDPGQDRSEKMPPWRRQVQQWLGEKRNRAAAACVSSFLLTILVHAIAT